MLVMAGKLLEAGALVVEKVKVVLGPAQSVSVSSSNVFQLAPAPGSRSSSLQPCPQHPVSCRHKVLGRSVQGVVAYSENTL